MGDELHILDCTNDTVMHLETSSSKTPIQFVHSSSHWQTCKNFQKYLMQADDNAITRPTGQFLFEIFRMY